MEQEYQYHGQEQQPVRQVAMTEEEYGLFVSAVMQRRASQNGSVRPATRRLERLCASQGWRVGTWALRKVGWMLLILIWGNIAALYEYGWYMDSPRQCELAKSFACMMLLLSLALELPPVRYAALGPIVGWLMQQGARRRRRVREERP